MVANSSKARKAAFASLRDDIPDQAQEELVEQSRESASRRLNRARQDLDTALSGWTKTGLPNVAPILPALLRLRGKPYSLANHYPFEPQFSTFLPRRLTSMAGRQVAKSTTMAAQGVTQTAGISYFNTLFVTPRFEQIRRFSVNYVKPFIDESPWRKVWVTPATSSSVLQRSFRNYSNMYFSFALLDADRTRGLPCDKISYDEVQDFEEEFLDIIREATSGSIDWKIEQFSGTPKTMDGPLQKKYEESSQAEWVIKCHSCGRLNIPSLEHDLLAMIGPLHDQISEKCPGTVCAKCRRPIFPRTGRWWHRYPDRIARHAGYHIPQIILPMHYAKVSSWYDILSKQITMPRHVFLNEVLGVSVDSGAKLLTETDLRAASVLHENTIEVALKARKKANYVKTVLSIDWGGGGIEEESWTVYAVLGLRGDGKIDVIYGYRSNTPLRFQREASIALEIAARFKVDRIVHDFNGSGTAREAWITGAGWPEEYIWPLVAGGRLASREFVVYAEELGDRRAHWRWEKARGLQTVAFCIQKGWIRFFKYDGGDKTRKGLINDFLALVEDRKSSRFGSDTYSIIRAKGMTDDFAQAVTMGSLMLWESTEAGIPNLANPDRFVLPQEFVHQEQFDYEQYYQEGASDWS
jgi:hypothetical protein